MDTDTNSYFPSRDLYFSSYLFAKGHKLISIEPDDTGSFYWFLFENKEACEREEQAFLKNTVSVKAKDFAEAIKFLKRKVSSPR
jgi:hypothetical protein